MPDKPIAVLIDAENLSASMMPHIWREIGKIGAVGVRRAYGNMNAMTGWAEELRLSHIQPRLQLNPGAAKNATDFALVIDAMDLLHGGHCGGFCIISSDSDFASLALRIQDFGLPVYGFGENKTPMHYRETLTKFHVLPIGPLAQGSKKVAPKAPVTKPKASGRKPIPTNLFLSIVKSLAGKDGRSLFAEVEAEIEKRRPNFDFAKYGYVSVRQMFEESATFDVVPKNGSREAYVKLP